MNGSLLGKMWLMYKTVMAYKNPQRIVIDIAGNRMWQQTLTDLLIVFKDLW